MHRDLSHRIGGGMPTYPGDPVVELFPHATHHADGYAVTAVGMGTHAGTHVDAPHHTEPDGRTIDEFPCERFHYDAHLVDARVGADEAITATHLDAAVDPEGVDLVVLHTGWAERWGEEDYFDAHPYLSPEAARWCVEREVDVGLDAPSVDPIRGDLVAHHELLSAGRLVVENLADLSGLPERFELYAFPLSLDRADGAPVRAVAEA